MGPTLRDLILRVFGSDQVEMRFTAPTSGNAPAPQPDAQPVPLRTEAPSILDEVTERRGSRPVVLRPASRAE